MAEFRNFQVATPDGLRDVTSAFRMYHALMERYERVALGDRPMWLVEVDRFWNVQQGGADPIHHWMTIPMLHFEPPASCVRRFWAGFQRLVGEAPGARILCATHSGPIRAFAAWAVGYDPGEPYNTEEVLVKLKEGAARPWSPTATGSRRSRSRPPASGPTGGRASGELRVLAGRLRPGRAGPPRRQERQPRGAAGRRAAGAARVRGHRRRLPHRPRPPRGPPGRHRAAGRGRPGRPGRPGGAERRHPPPHRGGPAGRRRGRRRPRRLPRAVRALRRRGGAGGGALLGHLRGPARRQLRRRARHLPVGPRPHRRPRPPHPLLVEPVHGQGDRLPARARLRPRRGRHVGRGPEDGPPHRRGRWPSPSTPATATAPRSRSRPPGASARASCPARSPRQLPGRQGPGRDRAAHHLRQGGRVPAGRRRPGRAGRGRPGPPDRPQPHRRPGQGGGPAGPAGRAALPLPPGRGVGPGRRPARRPGRDPAPGPPGDGLEPEGGQAGRRRRRPDGQHRRHPAVAAART